MKKRILSMVLALSMLISFMPIIASAATSGTCGDNLTWTFDNGTLTISGTGEMEDYYWEENHRAPWFKNRESIKNVVIEEGATNISTYAFYCCSNLINITISNSVTNIESDAFATCSSLTNITIPNSVMSIEEFAIIDNSKEFDCNNIEEEIHRDDEYIYYLMTVDEFMFEDEIDCRDLFPGNDMRERIVIFGL